MAEIDLESGEPEREEAKPKRGPGRPPKTAQTADLERDIREQLEELGEWARGVDAEFAETFLGDVAKMARFLATRAGKHERLARLLRLTFAKDGPLAGLRAFGRTTRILLGKLHARAGEHDSAETTVDGYIVDEHGNRRDPRTGQIVVPGA